MVLWWGRVDAGLTLFTARSNFINVGFLIRVGQWTKIRFKVALTSLIVEGIVVKIEIDFIFVNTVCLVWIFMVNLLKLFKNHKTTSKKKDCINQWLDYTYFKIALTNLNLLCSILNNNYYVLKYTGNIGLTHLFTSYIRI